MRKRALVVVVVAACGAVLKPPEPDRRLVIRDHGTLFESANGYRIAVLPEVGASVVRLDVRYPVGSVDDPPGKEGLAHLVEHLLFDMEIKRDGATTSINAELGRLALYFNAETTADYTNYEVVAPPKALDELVGLEVDRLSAGCGGLTPAIFEHEREVVMEELRERRGANGAELDRLLHEAVYPAGHPYRAVDSVESVAKLDFKDVCDFLAGPYRQGEAIFVASGAVAEAQVREAVGRHLPSLHPRRPATRAMIPTAPNAPGLVRLRSNVDEPLLVATWPLPPAWTHESHLLRLATASIAERMEAFAFTYGWGHSATTVVLGGTSAPVLAVAIELESASSVDDAISAAGKAVEFSERALGTETDSRAWKISWQSQAKSLLARWESLAGRNEMVAEMMSTNTVGTLISRIQELVAATPSATRDIAERWLDPKRARYILVEPDHAVHPIGVHHVAKPGAQEHAAMVDESLADKRLAVPLLAELEPIRFTLSNGLAVVLWPRATTSLVHGRLVVNAGTARDPAGAEGVASLEGADAYEDQLVYSDSQLSTRVDELVDNLTAELRDPGYTLSDEEKGYLKGRLHARHAKERLDFARDLAAAVYGPTHPYARVTMTETSVDKIHTDMTIDWARRYVVPSNSTLIITGQFDADLVRRYIEYDVGHVSAGKPAQLVEAADTAKGIRHVVGTTTTPSPTIELSIAFRAPGGLDRTYGARLVLAQVLDAKLAVLRSKRALSYGFYASFEPRHAGGLWQISGEADASRSSEAAAALLQVIDEVRTTPSAYRADFVIARQKVLEELMSTGSSARTVAEQLVAITRFDLVDDFYNEVADSVAALTLAQFATFVADELPRDREVRAAFGTNAAVSAADAVFAQ